MTERDPLLQEREKEYGDFKRQGWFAQSLKEMCRAQPGWSRLGFDQREALEMQLTKVSRILHGNPKKVDSWKDIAGYANLGAEGCE